MKSIAWLLLLGLLFGSASCSEDKEGGVDGDSGKTEIKTEQSQPPSSAASDKVCFGTYGGRHTITFFEGGDCKIVILATRGKVTDPCTYEKKPGKIAIDSASQIFESVQFSEDCQKITFSDGIEWPLVE